MAVSAIGYTQGYSYGNQKGKAAGRAGQDLGRSQAAGGQTAGLRDRNQSEGAGLQAAVQQPADGAPKCNVLMEAFEMMKNKGGLETGEQEEQLITDPFGLIRREMSAPYASYADKNGNITYNGVTFTTSGKWLCLGDMSNKKDVISIPFGGGKGLKVNRNNITELGRAIGMFSPEEQNKILRALQLDTKIREVQEEIEGMGDDVGAKGSRDASECESNDG